MDPKVKLNAKMYIAIFVCDLWIAITNACDKIHGFALRRTLNAQSREFDIFREMMNEDYPEAYKNEIREVLKYKEGL